MPLFKKKPEVIPPVAPPESSAPSYRSNTSTYAPSTYSNNQSTYSDNNTLVDKYSRSKGIGDVYSRGGGQVDQDRNELFAGYNAAKANSGRFYDGPTLKEATPGEENEEDVEGIKQQTRYVKQESVNSTRNALRLAREAEETARNTLTRLGDQSEKLANTERHLDVSKGHSQRAADKTDELKQLNRSIFRPVITFNKDAKRAAQEAKVQARYEEEREERERSMMDVRETQNRLGRIGSYGRGGDDEEELLGNGSSRFRPQDKKEQRKRYQFEATASDDEIEDELDQNLDEIGDVAKRLKALATGMGEEVERQTGRIEVISDKAGKLDQRIFSNTERLKRIK
ncbi:protein transporter SEC9 [Crepidotus variabilis]|uniref:Protein transporter SEC9 n=1 Tax=Crepidotus variabilis TaxID=179855 RepID=A0A9P6JNA5_9AGAR|nr:protein transporter SEC9 [Crepidotus variabilis]